MKSTERPEVSTRPRWDLCCVLVLLLLIALFLGQFLCSGYYFGNDSAKYINFSSRVSPLYPWFLWLFSSVFGENALTAAAIFQNLLTAWCIFSLCEYTVRRLSLGFPTLLLTVCTVAATFFAQTFFTAGGHISSNAILSEALAVPLYFLFFKYTLACFLEKDLRSWVVSAVFAFLITCTRGQLTWVMIVSMVSGAAVFSHRIDHTRSHSWAVRILFPVAIMLALYLFSTLCSTWTNRSRQDLDSQSTMGRNVVLGTVLYCSQPEDGERFVSGSAERAVFDEMTAFADETHAAARFAPRGLYARFVFFEENYDTLKDNISTVVSRYVPQELQSAFYLRFTLRLALCHPLALLRHCSMNFLAGIVRTAAIFSPGFTEAVLVLLLLCVIAVVYCRRRKLLPDAVTLMTLTLCCVLFNAVFVSFGVFALSRYMFYNLPILYMAGECCFIRVCTERKNRFRRC